MKVSIFPYAQVDMDQARRKIFFNKASIKKIFINITAHTKIFK